ncbi:hypothetical protein SK128_027771, partial [Halocaridina rubra]
MWHERSTRSNVNTSTSIDYQPVLQGNENELVSSSVGASYGQLSHLPRPPSSYAGDLRGAITGVLSKDSSDSDLRDSIEVRRQEARDLGDLRSSISKPASSYREQRLSSYESDLRSMISGAGIKDDDSREHIPGAFHRDVRVSMSGTNDFGVVTDRGAGSSYYSKAHISGQPMKDIDKMEHFADRSQEKLQAADYAFLAKTFKECVDPKLGWAKGSSALPVSMSAHRNQLPTNKVSYQQAGSSIPLMMNIDPTTSHVSLNPVGSHEVASISHSQLLTTAGLGVNLQRNLYPANELVMMNSLQNPIVVSAPLQIMEASSVAKGSTLGSFWDSLKQDQLFSRQKSFPKGVSVPDSNELSPVGEDFQMPVLSRKHSAETRRDRSRSPGKHSKSINRRSPLPPRKSPFSERIHQEREVRRAQKDDSRRIKRDRSRSPADRKGFVRRSRELSPHRFKEKSPKSKRRRSPKSSRHSRDLSPHVLRRLSPGLSRDRSPRRSREMSPKRYKDILPHHARDISPRRSRVVSSHRQLREVSPYGVREMSPRWEREMSPHVLRERPRYREMSPQLARETSSYYREMSPRRARDFPPHKSREISPHIIRDRARRGSPEYSRERSPYGSEISRAIPVDDRRGRERMRFSPEAPLYRRDKARSPIEYRSKYPEHYGESSYGSTKRYSSERSREYSPPPVRILSPERPHSSTRRSYSPVPVTVRRYPQEYQRESSHISQSPVAVARYPKPSNSKMRYSSRSSSKSKGQSPLLRNVDSPSNIKSQSPKQSADTLHIGAKHSQEEDRDSPRRSWDARLQPKKENTGQTDNGFVSTNSPNADRGLDAVKEQESLGQQKEAALDLAREASPISVTSNDDKEFGKRRDSPLFDEVSNSPKSADSPSSEKVPTPGTPTSDEKPKPVLVCDDLPQGSPVSIADLALDKSDEDEDKNSNNFQRDLSPVSLDENDFGDDFGMEEEENDRPKSTTSELLHESLIVTDSIDDADSPLGGNEHDGEDLRFQLQRTRDEKGEISMKNLEDESQETELRLQNLSPDLLDYSPMRDTPSPLLDECEDDSHAEKFET